MTKRDRLRVIYDILKIIVEKNNSIKPTPLLRLSNLSSQSFSEYLKELTSKNFVEIIENRKGRKEIKLTKKGYQYLHEYKTIVNFIETFGL